MKCPNKIKNKNIINYQVTVAVLEIIDEGKRCCDGVNLDNSLTANDEFVKVSESDRGLGSLISV